MIDLVRDKVQTTVAILALMSAASACGSRDAPADTAAGAASAPTGSTAAPIDATAPAAAIGEVELYPAARLDSIARSLGSRSTTTFGHTYPAVPISRRGA